MKIDEVIQTRKSLTAQIPDLPMAQSADSMFCCSFAENGALRLHEEHQPGGFIVPPDYVRVLADFLREWC